MILNAYAVLDAFLSLVRLGLGAAVLLLGLSAWRLWRRALTAEARKLQEDRCYLLFLLAGLLLAANSVSWPIFYLLLQSYVPEWPGVMCVYGVTKIGAGSLGTSRFLPDMVTALQVMKPAHVFLSGAWFVLYLVNRATQTAPLTGRVLVVLLAAGVLGVADAATEAAYLAIPKKEVFSSGGCCTLAFDEESRVDRFLLDSEAEDEDATWLYGAYYAVNCGMILVLGGWRWLDRRSSGKWWLVPLLLLNVLCLVISALFLIEAAAPRLLHLPYHHCPYDLIPEAPEAVVAVTFFIGGCLFFCWACVAGWLGRCSETEPILPLFVWKLLRLSLGGYLASLAMLSLELILA